MMGSFLTRGLVMVLGYTYPAYECFKTVEKNKPEIEQLRFWCQYWILVAVLTVLERTVDAFISWLPMYSEAKLAFFVYLWYPKTRGTPYIYDTFLRPYVTKHETEIDRNLLELRAKAGDIAFIYWQKAASYGQTRIFEIIQYIASQSPRPHVAQQAGGNLRPPQTAAVEGQQDKHTQGLRKAAGARRRPVAPQPLPPKQPQCPPETPQPPPPKQPQCPPETSTSGQQEKNGQETAPVIAPAAALRRATAAVPAHPLPPPLQHPQQQDRPSQEIGPSNPAPLLTTATAEALPSPSMQPNSSEGQEQGNEPMDQQKLPNEGEGVAEDTIPLQHPQDMVMEEAIRLTRGRLRKIRSASNRC